MSIQTIMKHIKIVFVLACLAALATIFISESSYWRSVDTQTELGATATARMNIRELQLSILTAMTAQRGYLLTGSKEYLQPYQLALKRVEESFRSLDRYYANQPGHMAVLWRLRTLTEIELAELAQTIRLHDEGKNEAAMKLILGNIDKDEIAEMRRLSDDLLEHEMLNVVEVRDSMYQALMRHRIGVVLFSAVNLLALFIYMRQTFTLEKKHEEIERTVQAERDRLESEVSQRTQQLTELTHHLQTAREDERSRLARNLHDDLGATLTLAKLDAARLKSRLAGMAPENLELLAHLVDTLNSGIALGRRIIEDLRPSALSNLGLVATLQILAREFADHSGIEVDCALEPVELEATAELMVYRLVQEAITNIIKYAQASHVWVRLGMRDDQVEVSVRDDGVGFDTTLQPRSAYGLVGMRFRIQAHGGILTLLSAPGQGTLIRATLAKAPPATPPDLALE